MLRILGYHRIAELRETPSLDTRNISATPANFHRQMRHVARYYSAVSVGEVLDAVKRKVRLPKRAILLTFDDAYSDFGEVAWPVLRRYRLPATLFVPTAYPDRPNLAFWWDRLYNAFTNTSRTKLSLKPFGYLSLANRESRYRNLRMVQDYIRTIPSEEAAGLVDSLCRQLVGPVPRSSSVLGWNQLRELAKDGVTLGSHTQTHPIMTQLSGDKIRKEVRGAQQDLMREIGFALPIFCYPNGDHDETVAQILMEEGIVLGFGVAPGINDLSSTNLLSLRRISIYPRTSMSIFWLRLRRLGIRLDVWRSCRLNMAAALLRAESL